MSNPSIPPVPGPIPSEEPDQGTIRKDGENILDPDANDALIDSATADRLAAEADPDALPTNDEQGS